MKYAVDRIESGIAICENLETREIVEISITELPEGVKEGDILKKEVSYILDTEEKKSREDIIREKMARLKH